MNLTQYNEIIDILNIHNYNYIYDINDNLVYTAIGIGDILFRLINIQEKLIDKPVYINLNMFLNGIINSKIWLKNPFNNFMFKISLLNDIIKYNKLITKKDFVFIITNQECNVNKMNTEFYFRKIKNYNLLIDCKFYIDNTIDDSIQKFIKEPFIIFHTKLRLNKDYDYNKIKKNLNIFFSGLKVHKFNIILLGEKSFEITQEGHNITTIYLELLKLYNHNSNKILDLTKEYIYNELNYDEYKNDICLINKAEYNICYGQGGQLCSSLSFGKTIFFDPIDEEFFYKNINLYNSGHRYFKRFNKNCEYLVEIL